MTLTEFKAWFEGFTENISKQPTQKQWARIQERVAEIDGEAITTERIVERYREYQPWWLDRYKWNGGQITCSTDSTTALFSLGQSEARSL